MSLPRWSRIERWGRWFSLCMCLPALALVVVRSDWGGLQGDPSQSSAAEPGVEVQCHTVLAGESLWSIAQEELGAGSRWRELADLNGIDDPRTLRAGAVLVLP